MPRPLILTKDAEERIVGALSAGADMALAAKLVGVTRDAIYRHGRKHPEVKERWDQARAVADERVVKSLFDAAINGNVTAMIFWLKNRVPSQWRDRPEDRADDACGAIIRFMDRIDSGEFDDSS